MAIRGDIARKPGNEAVPERQGGASRPRLFELGNDQNRLLIAADPQDRAILQPFLEPVTLLPGEILLDVDQPIDYVYFPQSGVISLLTMVQPGQFVETCTIGREGAVGLVTGLGSGTSLSRVVVQIAGRALRMRSAALREILPEAPSVADIKMRYGEALLSQILQTLACNTLHSVEQRLCRWLLICRDRTASNTVPLTQEALAEMLGVQRTTVTASARSLQARGFISYRRGVIECTDVEGLKATSCECYALMRDTFARLLPYTYDDPPNDRG
jgi:CRP-like cAMP-binding protein